MSCTPSSPKKEPPYLLTCVDWATRCIRGFGVVWNRDGEVVQQIMDAAPPAHRSFSDGFATSAQLTYSGTHAVAPGKSETFSVEGDNAEMRHYPTKALPD